MDNQVLKKLNFRLIKQTRPRLYFNYSSTLGQKYGIDSKINLKDIKSLKFLIDNFKNSHVTRALVVFV